VGLLDLPVPDDRSQAANGDHEPLIRAARPE